MASVSSSSATRLLFRDGKRAASLLLRARTTNLTETMQNTGLAIRSLLQFNQTPASQFRVFSESLSGLRGNFIKPETISERLGGKVEAKHGNGAVENEGNESEEETDFDDEEFDDIDDDDEEFDDSDEDNDDDEEVYDKSTRKNK